MNFGAMIERSLKLVRGNPVLWKLGLLALFTEGITSGVVSGPPFPTPPTEEDKQLEQFTSSVTTWVDANPELAFGLAALTVVVVLLVWYLSLRAKAGLILTVVDLEAGKPAPRFIEAYRAGAAAVWPLIGLYLLFGLIIAIVLAIPFAALSSVADGITEGQLLAFFLLSLPFIILIAAYVNFITKIAERAVILSKSRIWAALGTAHRFLFNRLGQSAVALLIDFGLHVLFLMLVIAIVVIAVGLAALVALALNAVLPQAIMAAVVGATVILFVAGFFLLAGWFISLMISYWTLVYRAFDYIGNKKGAKE